MLLKLRAVLPEEARISYYRLLSFVVSCFLQVVPMQPELVQGQCANGKFK